MPDSGAIHICICDDEAAQAEHLGMLVADWAREGGRAVALAKYPSAEAFLFAWEGGATCDILLLDIQMGGMDGMALAEGLREKGARLEIVFITAHEDFMARGYDVSALHYLLKPVSGEKLSGVLEKAAARMRAGARAALLDTPAGAERVPLESILYAEAFSHDVEVRLADGRTLRVRHNMGELAARFGDGFFRCHRSYLVNLSHVRLVARASLRLDDGGEVPLARAQYDAANQAFIRYYNE